MAARRTRSLLFCLSLCALAATALGACGDDGASGSCDQPVREELDPASLTHVIDPESARFRTDPPTSGPHVSAALPTGVVTEPILPAIQVAILEGGGVLLQHRDLSPTDAATVESLVGDHVVVAPNPGLPAPVVATAWTYKLTCDAVDAAALERFIDDHAGREIGH